MSRRNGAWRAPNTSEAMAAAEEVVVHFTHPTHRRLPLLARARYPEQVTAVRDQLGELWVTKGSQLEALMDEKNNHRINGPGNWLTEADTLRHAQLWWVDSHMCDVLYASMKGVPGDVTPAALTAPSTCGLVVFQKPWAAHDSKNDSLALTVDAITWAPGYDERGRPHAALSFYSWLPEDVAESHDHEEDGTVRADIINRHWAIHPIEECRCPGLWYPVGGQLWPWHHRLDDMRIVDGRVAAGANRAGEYISTQEDRQLIAALFTLIASPGVAEITEHKPSRQVVKNAQRHKEPVPSPVKVVYLRRPKNPTPEDHQPGEREYSHRWIVQAHFRNQACGPGHKDRKLITVGPYVKGPSDKPLVVKETVRALVR